MMLPPCEFRDPDGSYLVVQPFDEVRCRVMASNVARKGEVLYKDETLSWTQAAQDLGGWTRLGPGELLGTPSEPIATDPEDTLSILEEKREGLGADRLPDPEGDIVDPRTLPAPDFEAFDPRVELLRLAIHYRKAHERREGGRRFVSLCRCPEFGPTNDPVTRRLHAVVTLGILKNELPTLPRISRAIREIEERRGEVA